MLAQVFLTAGRDPSVHIGGELDYLGGSTRRGRDEFILEACEYNRSFLHFYPTVAVILNIDEDHLDCYKDIDDIEATFLQFARLAKSIVGWGDDMRVQRVIAQSGLPHITYGLGEGNTLRPEGLCYDEHGRARFTALWEGKNHRRICPSACPGRPTCSTRWPPSPWRSRAVCRWRRSPRRCATSAARTGATN